MPSRKKIFVFWCCLLFSLSAVGAQNAPVSRPITEEQWQKAASGLDFSQDLPKPPQLPRERRTPPPSGRDWTFNTEAMGKLLQVLAIMVAVGLIGYALYRIMQEPGNRRIALDGTPITLENLEEYLHETDLEQFLRQALAQGDYPQAVRVHYLRIIKELSSQSLIGWSREKTNLHYLREMRGHRLYPAFKQATQTYERVWYGNASLDAEQYARIEPIFKNVGL